MENLQRPGGELATRPIHFFWMVDCSGSMYGEKIGIVNNTIQECIPQMRSAAENNPNAQLMIRALQFSTGASWITTNPIPVEDYSWETMDAEGLTSLGKAFDLLAAQLSIPPMPERALPPVVVLLSDGQPTDDYKESLANDNIALAYDYYDRYYENVLSKLDTIVVSEDTSIKNQEQIISKLDTVTLTFNTILFVILLWFLIDVIRHMWKK